MLSQNMIAVVEIVKTVLHTVYKTIADRTIIGDTRIRLIAKDSI